MSLATRCSACGTVFRVVQDQLRVSGGWVRCGRCTEVFNAIESLVDLELDRPTEDAELGLHGARVVDDLARFTRPGALAPAAPDETSPPLRAAKRPSAPHEPVNLPPAAKAPVVTDEEPESAANSEDEAVVEAVSAPAPALDLRGEPIIPERPAFVRRAERAARWRRPSVRWSLSLLGLTAAVLLAGQVLLAWHDLIAAHWPVTTPMLSQLCQWQGCRIEPPRRIDSLTVDSSGLLRAEAPGHYRLALVMRNRESAMALRLPSIDLALTDALGQPLARRVLDPTQFGVESPHIAAGAELALSATLHIGVGAVAGYTIELFYP